MVQVPTVEPLTAENMLWSNTVLAAGTAVGFVIYTGAETRAVMNTSHPETKVGLLDVEINRLAKVCQFIEINTPSSSLADFVCCDIRTLLRTCGTERIQGPMVHLHSALPHLILFHYTHQVRFIIRVARIY